MPLGSAKRSVAPSVSVVRSSPTRAQRRDTPRNIRGNLSLKKYSYLNKSSTYCIFELYFEYEAAFVVFIICLLCVFGNSYAIYCGQRRT
ncbi:MAG: hypothetical protein NZ455_04370 [Bacteroidia bacterium]|nr:hypothetical protein [Bacteroidia bacterium]MDW8345729.1 hypothetical protein [Bacteroidia bacterium]